MTIPDRDIEALVRAFAENSDPDAIAEKLGLTPELVAQMLDDPEVGQRAIRCKVDRLGIVFAGRVIDNLVTIAATGNAQHALQAIKALEKYMAPAKNGRPPKDEPDEPSYEEGLGAL